MSKGHSPRKYNPRKWSEGYERAFAEWKERRDLEPDEEQERLERLIDQADMLRAERKENRP
jgi:hypothetical protein